jgi:hypothetical protein
MGRHRPGPLRFASVLVVAVALSVFGFAGSASSEPKDLKYRWDIVSIDFDAGTVSAGGTAAAMASDDSKIVLTGSGTFRPGLPSRVSGGGTWRTLSPRGAERDSGTYRVTRLVSFARAPGDLQGLTDEIGDLADARAGLAHLRIRYSDGSTGVLTVSCHLHGTPDSVFEGVTASKAYVTYVHPVPPVDGVDANRTLFHVRD